MFWSILIEVWNHSLLEPRARSGKAKAHTHTCNFLWWLRQLFVCFRRYQHKNLCYRNLFTWTTFWDICKTMLLSDASRKIYLINWVLRCACYLKKNFEFHALASMTQYLLSAKLDMTSPRALAWSTLWIPWILYHLFQIKTFNSKSLIQIQVLRSYNCNVLKSFFHESMNEKALRDVIYCGLELIQMQFLPAGVCESTNRLLFIHTWLIDITAFRLFCNEN